MKGKKSGHHHDDPSPSTYFRGVVTFGQEASSLLPVPSGGSSSSSSSDRNSHNITRGGGGGNARTSSSFAAASTTGSGSSSSTHNIVLMNPQDAVHLMGDNDDDGGAGLAVPSSPDDDTDITPNNKHDDPPPSSLSSSSVTPLITNVRSRKVGNNSNNIFNHHKNRTDHHHHHHHRVHRRQTSNNSDGPITNLHSSGYKKGRRRNRSAAVAEGTSDHHHHHDSHLRNQSQNQNQQQQQQQPRPKRLLCCRDRNMVRSTLSCMNLVARVLFWSSVVALAAAVVWYSYELKNNGKDPHLIAWFSAGAFVLLGFPISLYGIVMHLANYNQPETQSYIVRILWMVPIYSIESWLCLRYKDYAIYIETLRDCYESYVLYSFLQFLIQVLGGEESLILMLKDKSPTRGVHMWGLQWCVKPWLMGQPVRKSYMVTNSDGELVVDPLNSPGGPIGTGGTSDSMGTMMTGAAPSSLPIVATELVMPAMVASTSTVGASNVASSAPGTPGRTMPLKRVHWTSPFFVKCKFGVLQYVLLKFVCSIAIFILERSHLYKEGDFTYKGGYLYICILTNVSQCWALYCLFFFYFATKNELAPIRPVGKFLSVKALVFFTWWQSVGIAVLYNMDLIPHYRSGASVERDDSQDLGEVLRSEPDWSVPLSVEDALALDEYGGGAFWASPTTGAAPKAIIDYTPQDVAKGLQDYLICIEMFVAAIVHFFVFPHTEYLTEAVEARARAMNQLPNKNWNKRLGRKWKDWDNRSGWSGTTSTSRDSGEIELLTLSTPQRNPNYLKGSAINSGGKHNNNNNEPDTSLVYQDSLDEDDLRIHPMDKLDEDISERRPLLLEEDEDREEKINFVHKIDEDCDDDDHASETSVYDDEDEYEDSDDFEDEEVGSPIPSPAVVQPRRKNFVSALLDSTIPQDLRDNTVGIIKGDYVVEKKTLLHHAATSDSYDLFSRFPKRKMALSSPKSTAAGKQDT